MALCAIIGTGRVAERVVQMIRQKALPASIIALRECRSWLRPIDPKARFLIGRPTIGGYLSALEEAGATEVFFAGMGLYAVRSDGVSARYIRPHTALENPPEYALWRPHGYMHVLLKMLEKHDITLKSPLDVFPALRIKKGFTAGGRADYDPIADFRTALVKIAGRPPKLRSQACIISGEKVLWGKASPGETNELLQSFGTSNLRSPARLATLCKLTIPLFEKLYVPTIGLDTVRLSRENGVGSIVVEAEKTLLMQRAEVRRYATAHSIGVYALERNILNG
jgi:DUF1009 family protein